MSFTDPLTFLPLYAETVDRIRARFDADINAGLLPTDEAFVDTREGGFYWDLTQVIGLEIARLWDSIGSETVAAAFPSVAWGEYLDEHGATFNLPRQPATPASAEVLFVGTPGSTVTEGVQVDAEPSDPSLDAITFQTSWSDPTPSFSLPAALVPNVPVVVASPTGGSLAAGTYYYHVTATAQIPDPTNTSWYAIGETTGTPDQSALITTTTGSVTLTWSAVAGAAGYNVYRSNAANTLGNLIASTTGLSFTDSGVITPTTQEPSLNTTSGVLLPTVAVLPGTSGNLGPNALTTLASVVPGISFVTNVPYFITGSPPTLVTGATTGGTDVENDDNYRARILSQFQGHGAGNIADYNSWALTYPGVERAATVPVWDGAGTVLVIAMLADGTAVSSTVVTGLQQQLDPVPGLGHGLAPIGAAVTVTTTTNVSVDISGTVINESGYSLDGSSGSIPTRPGILNALTDYLATLGPGDTIVYQKIIGAFVGTPGVAGINSLLVSGGTANIVLLVSPAENPVLGTVALS